MYWAAIYPTALSTFGIKTSGVLKLLTKHHFQVRPNLLSPGQIRVSRYGGRKEVVYLDEGLFH